MNNFLKFVIKLQADGNNVMSVSKKVMSGLDELSMTARSTGAAIRSAFAPSAFGESLMALPGMQFLTNPYTLIGAGIGAVAKLGSEAEMTATSFGVLVGNEEKAKALLGEIGKFASESSFGKLDLTANAQQMLAFGVETDKVMTYMRQLGDISGGSKDKLSSLSLVMGQVFASGKLSGQDNMQFINAGFNPLKELQKIDPSKTYEELQEAMSKGKITADLVAKAIAHATEEGGQFHGMMEKTSATVSGRWASAMDGLQEMAVNVFEQIKPYIASFVDGLNAVIPKISSALVGLFSVISGVIDFFVRWKDELLLVGSIIGIVTIAVKAKTIALMAYAGSMSVVSTATKIWTGVQWLLNVALSANPIGIVIAGIGALIAVVVYCWNKFAGFRAFLITAWDTFKKLGSIIKDYVVNRIKEMLEGIGKVGKAIQLLLSGKFSEAWSTFKDGFGNIHGKNSAKQAVQATKEVVSQVSGDWQKNLKTEQDKDKKGKTATSTITDPTLKGSAKVEKIEFGKGKDGKGKKGNTANGIATGGSRPTTINMNINKLIETLSVRMHDKADSRELQDMVLQTINRALAIATSTE